MSFANFVRERVPRYQPPIKNKGTSKDQKYKYSHYNGEWVFIKNSNNEGYAYYRDVSGYYRDLPNIPGYCLRTDCMRPL